MEKHSVDIVSVFKMMPGSNVLVQPDTPRFTIVAASDDYLQATGRNRDELIGKGLFEAFPNNPEDAAQTSEKTVQASLEYVLAHKEPHHLPVQRYDVAGDGRYHERYWTAVNKPVFNNEGEVAFIIHSIEDVTARIKNQQHQVRESEEKYRQLFESMDQGFCVVEMIFDEENKPIDYRFLEINPVFEKQTGIKDATGKTVRELVPALESYWFELYGKVALTGEPMRFSQGSAALGRWFDVYAYRIGNSSSRKIALLFTDATERKRAEDAIRQSEQQVRALVESAPFPIGVYIGREMKITFVNQSIIDVWGKGADVVGKLYSEVLPELAGQRIYQQLDDVYTTGKPFHAKNQRVDLVVDGTLQPFYF
ncbi:MAG TPA: PAS domain S-box protein, partial [Chitinophagaceae bacterium]|nr:PAS domain S-box protein [Chitinophagaceae bacterium]